MTGSQAARAIPCGGRPARRQEGCEMANPLRTLQEYGQSVWLDFVSRELLKSAELGRLIAEDGLRGITSNPSILEKAIGHGEDYDAQIAAAEKSGDLDPGALFEDLAIRDIQDGADALNVVYEQTQRRDGYISIEVSPYLAMQTHETIEEARRLWRNVGRRNLMVKVPATGPGLPAIRTLIGEGINVNITLLFSQKVYAAVADAYISGLEDFVAKGGDPHKAATMDACRDHGRARASLEEDVGGAQVVMEALPGAGISIDAITSRLVEDGVRLFADAADQLYAAVQKKRRTVLGSKLNAMSYKLPKELDEAVQAALEEWRSEGEARRLWAGDASRWAGTDEGEWLGWLTVVDEQLKAAGHLEAFAAEVKRAGFSEVLLLGMGGSSLGAEVLAHSFGSRPGFPRLQIVDSTDPAQLRRIESSIDLKRTLFIQSSKSGSTLEPNSFT